MELLFVYGTLLSSINHPVGENLRLTACYRDKGWAYGKLYDIGEYPGFVPQAEKGLTVVGEVYDLRLCPDLWAALDAYEGVGESDMETAEYSRQKISVVTIKGTLTCWTYVYQETVEHLSPIRDGDYLAYFLAKNQ